MKNLLICPAFFLAACGGGSPSFDTAPFSSLGFASDGIEEPEILTFDNPGSLRILRTLGQNTRFENQNVSITMDEQSEQLSVTLDGVTYVLSQDPNDESEFIFEDETNYLNLEGREALGGALVFDLFTVLDGELNAAFVVTGIDTDPAEIIGKSDSATYEGVLEASLRRDDYGDAFGDGTFTLTANFDSNEVSGSGIVADDGGGDFSFSAVSFNLDPTNITENNFAGVLSLQTGDLSGELVTSGYEGRFFGVEGGTVAGTGFAQIDIENDPDDTFVELYFIGSQPDE